jgi:hypothetical protein
MSDWHDITVAQLKKLLPAGVTSSPGKLPRAA